MNLYDFFRNNHEQRAALVRSQGEFLVVRHSSGYSICLFSMGSFFAEIWYRIGDNKIDLVRGFTGTSCLEPYLEMVSLSEINS